MPEKIVGLDIGKTTIKALLLERKGRFGGRVLAMDTINISADCSYQSALEQLAQGGIFTHLPCLISLPLQDLMFRQVSLPFHDERKIRKTLPFELEPLLPFPVDEIVADYLPTPPDGLLVAVATRKFISEWITLIESNLGTVPAINISSAPVVSLLPDMSAAAGCGILLDVGSDSTAINIYEDGSLVQIRSIAFGGNQITAALAQDLCVGEEEAETIKKNGAYGDLGKQTHAVCRDFCLQLKNTMEMAALNGTRQKYPEKITLTGGGSLFAPLQKELEKYFILPVALLNLGQLKQIEIAENIQSKYNPQIMDGALANALGLIAGVHSFNFRRGEFQLKTEGDKFYRQYKWAAWAVSVILLMAISNQFLDYSLQSRRLDNIKKQISVLFKKNYPEAAAMVDPVGQLKTKLAENKKTFGSTESGADVTVLDLLKDISTLVPPSLDVLLTNFSYENDVVLLKAEAKNIDAVSALKTELMKSKYFKEVSIGTTNLTKQGGKVEFDLRITVK